MGLKFTHAKNVQWAPVKFLAPYLCLVIMFLFLHVFIKALVCLYRYIHCQVINCVSYRIESF
jgi:hypothetical protein